MTEAETKKVAREIVREMFPELFEENLKKHEEKVKNEPADEYAKPALEWAKENGIMVGDKTGNQKPQEPAKREDVVVMMYAQEKKNGRA